jgi:hypothetical protein
MGPRTGLETPDSLVIELMTEALIVLTEILDPNYLHMLLINTSYLLTEGRTYCECHTVARVLDQVHNVSMMKTHDINVIYCQNAITNM